MGGNGSYSPSLGYIPLASRTHLEYDQRIEGHKILVQADGMNQRKIPMNANSESPTYLVGSVDKDTGCVKISTIALYESHKLVKTIDMEFDGEGNVIPYQKGQRSSHSHEWSEDISGRIGRKSHSSKNTLPVDIGSSLIDAIVKFNKELHKWKQAR